MLSTADLVLFLHHGALWAFVGVTAVSMLVVIGQRIRLRRPLLSWPRPGFVAGLPPGPSLFLLLVGAGFGHAWLTGRSLPPAVLVGYPAGGLFWLVAAWMLRTVVVTEYGLVPDLSRIRRAVVWSRIVDYVVTSRDDHPHFIFFYRANGERHRLDLPVPPAHAPVLREIVRRKIDPSFSVPAETVCDDEALNRLDDRVDRP